MLPPHVASIATHTDCPMPARSGMQGEVNSSIHVSGPDKITFPVLSLEATNELGENTSDGSQREVPSNIGAYSRSKALCSESEALAFPILATHLSEPTAKVQNPSSNPSKPNDSASNDRRCLPSQSRSRVSGFSQRNPSNITRCLPLLGPLVPPKTAVDSTAATTGNRPSLSRPVPVPLTHRRSESTASQDPHLDGPANTSSTTLNHEIPDQTNFKTPITSRISRNTSTTSLGSSPTPANPELRQIGAAANWTRTGFERRSSGSGSLLGSVHFPSGSRSRVGSYGEGDDDALKARERRWGSGLPVPRPPSSRGSEESTKRTYSLDRPSSECGYTRTPSNGTNRRSSVSNLLPGSVRASSRSRSRAASGGESDIEILKERERRWGSGLPIPKPPTPGKPESTIKRRFSLGHRSTRDDVQDVSIETTDGTHIKPNWATTTPRVEPVSKREIGDGLRTVTGPSVLDTTFQQHPISAIAESPNVSLHSHWANLTPLGPVVSPLTTSVIAGAGPLVEAYPNNPSPDGSLNSPDLSSPNENGHTIGETLLHVSIIMVGGDSATLNDLIHPPSASLNETGTASPVTITREMSIPEVLAHLGRHGCNDVTSQLDVSKSSEHPISSGGFGDVYRGACHDGSQVAIKCLRLQADSTDMTKRLLKDTARELYVWSKCSHSNVLTLIGVAQYRSQIAMVSPWMEYGNLRRLISLRPQVDRYMLCVQIADGVKYMHDNGIVHGDLKGDNILFADKFTPKLTDFGNAALKKYTLKFSASIGMAGVSPHWAAPEVVKEETSKPTAAADVWSLGMTMLEAATGAIPYAGLQTWSVIWKIACYDLPARPEEHLPAQIKHSDLLWSLLIECWAQNPGDRPSSMEVRDKMNFIISTRDAEHQNH